MQAWVVGGRRFERSDAKLQASSICMQSHFIMIQVEIYTFFSHLGITLYVLASASRVSAVIHCVCLLHAADIVCTVTMAHGTTAFMRVLSPY